jgi:hypothetical protein
VHALREAEHVIVSAVLLAVEADELVHFWLNVVQEMIGLNDAVRGRRTCEVIRTPQQPSRLGPARRLWNLSSVKSSPSVAL